MPAIRGVLPVVQVPYSDDYAIDYSTLQRELEWLFACGVQGVVFGMVSEIFRITDADRPEPLGLEESHAGKGRYL